MMHCPLCGTINSAQARYCSSCGHLLVNGLICRTCHTLLPTYARFCSHCGDILVLALSACPHCGVYLTPGQDYCAACGNQIVAQPAGSPQAQPVAPGQAAPPRVAPAAQPLPPRAVPIRTPGVAPVAGVVPPAPPVGQVQDLPLPFRLPQARPIQELLPSLRRYLPQALYDPLERRPNERHIEQTRDHLAALLETAKTYLPRPVVEVPQPAGEPAGGMYRGVFLFGDVSGFTPLSEQLKKLGQIGAERITDIINDLFSELVSVLFDHGGTLLKFGGDALLGLFSAETDEEMAAGAQSAAQAAMAMQSAMSKFEAIEAAGETRALRIKCGISSGPYFAAHIGTPQSMAYVTTGHTVNRAEQAEGHANPGDVVITQDAFDLLAGQIEVEPRAEGFYLVRDVPLPEEGALERFVLQEPPEGEVLAQIAYLVDRMDRLSPYLPSELIARIVTHPGDARISPDHRPVTVMFVNYVGISDLIEDMGESQPELITQQLNRYFVHMAEVVERYEGTLARMDQYAVGDRLVVFFGAPRAHEDDPVRAVYTALDMQKATRSHFSALQTPSGIYRFRQRIGINTGHLFAGNVGARGLRQEYTLMGDDINMAARLMSSSGWQQIYISKKTRERVVAFFDLEDRGELKVKGKEILIPTFEVKGRRGEIGRTRGLEAGESPLIGRAEALETLQSRASALLTGHGQVISIIGESGLGKSRLLREAKSWFFDLEEAQGVRWLEGQSLSFSEQIGYWLAEQMLRSALDLGPDANDDDVLFALWDMGESLLSKETAREVIPFLAHMMSLELEGDWAMWVKELDPQVRQKQTFWAAREFFTAFARRQPTVIALDDLHWADEGSLALLMDLLEVSVQAPLMFCLVFRAKREKGCWRLRDKADTAFHHRYTEIVLEPLSEADSRDLLGLLLPGAEFSPEIAQEILDKAAGNPFYLEEVIRSLIDSGAVEEVDESGQWRVTAVIDQITVPDTLQGAIISRIDRLTGDARQALQMAAVIGRRFQMQILSNLAHAETEMGSWLAQLERSDLIQPVDFTAEPAYIFPDALVHEVAYDNLLIQRRQEFHRQVGDVLEGLLGERLELEAELLAYHFSRSSDQERAIKYLEMAARKVRDEYANETALQYYQQLYRIQVKRGDQAGQADALYQMGVVAYKWGDYDRARPYLERAIALRREVDDPAGEGWSVMYLGMVYFMEGNYSEAFKCHQHARQLALDHQDTFQEGIHLTNLARVSLRLGAYEQAAKQLERSLEMKIKQDDVKGQGFAHFYIGLINVYLEHYEEAEAALQQSLELRKQLGDERELGYCLYGLGLLALHRRRIEDAEDWFRQAYEQSSRLDLKAETITNLSYLAQVQLALGRPEEASETSHQAMALLEEQKSVEEVQQIYLNHYHVLSAVGDPSAGEVLQLAHDAMMSQAYRIADREKRQAFLEQVKVNQEINVLVGS